MRPAERNELDKLKGPSKQRAWADLQQWWQRLCTITWDVLHQASSRSRIKENESHWTQCSVLIGRCGVIINHYWMPRVAPWSGWVPFLHLDNGWAGLNNDLCCLEAFFCRTDFSVFGLTEIAEESRGLNPSLRLRAREWERWDAGLHFNSSSGVIHLHISSKSTLLLASG